MNKVQLRKYVTNIISNIPEKEKQSQSQIVFRKLIEHPKYINAKRLSIYLSTENEIDTKPLLKHAFENHKQCFIPLVRKSKNSIEEFGGHRMIMIELKSMKDFDELPINNYGIKEPKLIDCLQSKRANPNEESHCLDLMIVPGVAFSPNCARLGHGKGYYDEFLNNWYKQNNKLYTIGLCFKEQLCHEHQVPMIDGHDFVLNEIIVGDNKSYKRSTHFSV